MLIDTHAHIHAPEYTLDPTEVLERARQAGIRKIITIGTSPTDNIIAKTFADKHDDVYWTYGYHPSEYTGDAKLPQNPAHIEFLTDPKLVAIGEVGLDYHYKPYDRERQIALLEAMIDLAQKRNLPLVFHVREAFNDFWAIVDNAHVQNAVLHSFSDDAANLEQALRRDFFIGVNGLATFAPIPIPPLENIILETDAPYLTPNPFRGKINEPGYIKDIALWLADQLQVPLATVADQTTANATKLFKF